MEAEHFETNIKYIVLKTFCSHTRMFKSGEVLTYIGEGYNRFEGGYEYDFIDASGELKVVDNYDENSQELFNLFDKYGS